MTLIVRSQLIEVADIRILIVASQDWLIIHSQRSAVFGVEMARQCYNN